MKSVLITGASRGIGHELARAYAREGYAVAVNYFRSKAAAEALCEKLRPICGCAIPVCADVSDEQAVSSMFRTVYKEFSTLDVLVNNAGIAQQKLFTELTLSEFERMFAVNMTGTFLCCRAAAPQMIHRKFGRIINISSMWGQVGASCETHYSASKAAVIGFTKALAKELAPSGITVNCIAPGVIDTEMNAALSEETLSLLKEEIPVGTIGTPRDIASAALFFSSDAASYITGQVLGINGGMIV